MKKFLIVLACLYTNAYVNGQCPQIGDILNKGYNINPPGSHTASESNLDELGIIRNTYFFTKVSNYPPLKSFPIKPKSGCSLNTVFYSSFDTRNDNPSTPLYLTLDNNNWHWIKTFNYNGTGYKFQVNPPSTEDVHDAPDFIMNFDGTKHTVAWDEQQYWPWESFVTQTEPYTAPFSVNIEGQMLKVMRPVIIRILKLR